MDERELARLIWRFMEDGERLKFIPRAGWWYYGIKEPESVADHTFAVAVLTFVLASYLKRRGVSIDPYRATVMAVFHELGESRIGDIHLEARKYIPDEQLDEAERRAYGEVVGVLGEVGEEILKLYGEFESRGSSEALVVRAADKLELLFQAYIYEKHGYRTLQAFWNTPQNRRDFYHFPLLKALYEVLTEMRSQEREEPT